MIARKTSADFGRGSLQGSQPVVSALETPADLAEGEGQTVEAFVVEPDRPRDVNPVRERVVGHGAEVFRLATEVDQFLFIVSIV
jgi:hypothetical protein